MAATVLVVDDDPDFLELLDIVLSEKGYEVATSPSAEEAIDKARELSPAVVILDLRMPGAGGLRAIEALKTDPSTVGIHIIVCTADSVGLSRSMAIIRQWGCDVLVKPFEIEDLLTLTAKGTGRQ